MCTLLADAQGEYYCPLCESHDKSKRYTARCANAVLGQVTKQRLHNCGQCHEPTTNHYMNIIIITFVIAVLIFLNALYVAAEFSTVSARRPRLAQRADEGDRLASVVLPIVENPKMLDTFIAACQLGITITSLLLGYFGQARLTPLIAPFFVRFSGAAGESIAATVILFSLTIVAVVLGELIPKNLGVQYAERMATYTVLPMRWSIWLFRPLIWFFNGSGQIILRMMGASAVAEHVHVHSPEEILVLVEESSAGGVLDQEERRLLVNTLHLRDLTARRVMVPRNRILTAPADAPSDELLVLLAESPYSRLLLHEVTIDKIVGFVHLKDLLCADHRSRQPDGQEGTRSRPRTARDVMRPVEYVPESQPAEDILRLMQRTRIHLIVVVDEYGGTAGMITIEDLFEEIIGDFHDEFDASPPPIERRGDDRVTVQGDVQIEDLNAWLQLTLPIGDVDTVGGLVFSLLGRLPKAQDEISVSGISLRVERMAENSVAEVSLSITPAQAAYLEEIQQ